MIEKNKLLYSRYGKDIRYKDNVYRTILGFERQVQLLGWGEETGMSSMGEIMNDGKNNYDKYLEEGINLTRGMLHLRVVHQPAIGKFVGTVGIIHFIDNGFDHLVVHRQSRCDPVFFQIKQPGIVFFIGTAEVVKEILPPLAFLVHGSPELSVRLDFPVLGDPEENQPVDGQLDGIVDLLLIQFFVPETDVGREGGAPVIK